MQELTLRPAAESDYQFLWELHRAAFHDYVDAIWGWDETWQRDYFDEHFNPAERQIIVFNGIDIGTLGLEQREDELFVERIALLPDFQNQGIGTALMSSIVEDAHADGFPVRLSVLKGNPAIRLYERLGFRVYDEDDVRFNMVAEP